ncbi:beta-1,3-galactosyltransferase 5-like [Pecten maximus]|uniref:beta-1,3-galactosyltransferase 5-like n=1 Tax=Pecten maximus TaxID=6579 RepID=UPI0014581C2A|nr:beta-1,3-galactosyltransferase 5-like [Pecten maximus]
MFWTYQRNNNTHFKKYVSSAKIMRIVRKGLILTPAMLAFWCVWSFVRADLEISKPFLFQPTLNCIHQSPKSIVITVISKASNSLQRETIRQTWGSRHMQKKYNFSLYFLLGTEKKVILDNEINLKGDIIQADIAESYFHLTEKTVEAFKWMTLFCHKADYFFKTDDDVFFDLEFLKEIQADGNYLPDDVILGHCVFNVGPSRGNTTKHDVSYEEYPFQEYPPYCGGPGYMMTLKTARKVYRKMLTTQVFKFEDVYLGIVISKLGLRVKDVKYFVHLMNKENRNQSFFVRCSRVIHNLTPDFVQLLWDEIGSMKRFRDDCV